MIDDFRNEFSFIEYVEYAADVRTWDCCKIGSERKRQEAGDNISVFLNYKKLGEFKDRKSANKLIQKLLDEAPVSLEEFKEYVLQ